MAIDGSRFHDGAQAVASHPGQSYRIDAEHPITAYHVLRLTVAPGSLRLPGSIALKDGSAASPPYIVPVAAFFTVAREVRLHCDVFKILSPC